MVSAPLPNVVAAWGAEAGVPLDAVVTEVVLPLVVVFIGADLAAVCSSCVKVFYYVGIAFGGAVARQVGHANLGGHGAKGGPCMVVEDGALQWSTNKCPTRVGQYLS